MTALVVDIIFYVVTVFVFMMSLPYAKRLSIILLSDYLRSNHVRAATFDESKFDGDKHTESISTQSSKYTGTFVMKAILRLDPKFIENTMMLLRKAGMYDDDAFDNFFKTKIISCVMVSVICIVLFVMNETPLEEPWMYVPISIVLGIYGGHKLSDSNLIGVAEHRSNIIEIGVPDLIDLLVICTESGLDLSRAIRRIARELRTSNQVLADELSLTSIEMEMIPDLKQVFENFAHRVDIPQVNSLSKALAQSIEYGSSLSVTLRDLAVEARQKKMLDAETKAAKVPTLLTLPMMFFTLPCLFIIMLGPVIVGASTSFDNADNKGQPDKENPYTK